MTTSAHITPPNLKTGVSDWMLKRDSEQYVDRLENRLSQVRLGSTRRPGGSLRADSQSTDCSRPTASVLEESDESDRSIADGRNPNVENSVREEENVDFEGHGLLALATPFAGAQEELLSRQMQIDGSVDVHNRTQVDFTGSTKDIDHSAFVITSTSPISSNDLFCHVRRSSSTTMAPCQSSEDIAQGVFFGSISDSSQVLATLSSPAINTSRNPPTIENEVIKQTHDGKIQFHDIVRIAGGLAYKPKKRKKMILSSKSSSEINIVDPYRRRSMNTSTSGLISASPPRNVSESSDRSLSGFDRSTSQPSTSRSSMGTPHGTTPPRSQTRSPPPSPAWQYTVQKSRLARHPSGLMSLRRPSMSDSVTGSVVASTIASRSTSPASSIYVPLRVPVVRAPAPFYGPTPERVTLVRERRKVAERDAERAKGGWKAWWNDWFYQSDDSAVRKGKMSTAHHHHHHDHVHGAECHGPGDGSQEDSDDGSCYHDVIIEHERSKLERRLQKLKRAAATPHRPRPSQTPNPSSASTSAQSLSWFPQWWGSNSSSQSASRSSSVAAPARPVHGILNHWAGSSPNPSLNTQTPLLGSSQNLLPQYVNGPATPPKTEVDVRFGRAPGRWFRLSWWTWKIKSRLSAIVGGVKEKFVDLFHVDWDTDSEHYDGWENA